MRPHSASHEGANLFSSIVSTLFGSAQKLLSVKREEDRPPGYKPEAHYFRGRPGPVCELKRSRRR